MGRFYKTVQRNYVDNFIYQPPVELMTKTIGNADNQIKENETALLSLYDKLQANSLKVDEPRLKEIIGGYQSQIEEMAGKIQTDPLAFRKEIGNIRQLSRTINNDWTQGEVSAIQGNYGARAKFVKDHLEKTKKEKGYVTQDDVTFATNKFDTDFNKSGGTGYKGPDNYNQYKAEDLNPFVNIEERAMETAKGWLADSVTKNNAYTDGKYIYKSKDMKEVVPYKEVKQGILSSMVNDKELMAYYGQQVRLGRFSQEEVAGKLSQMADVAANKYSYSKTEKGKTGMDENQFALQKDSQAFQMKMKMMDWGREDKKELAGPAIDANIRTGEQLDILNKSFSNSMNVLGNKLGVQPSQLDGRLRPKDIRSKIETLKRLARTSAQKKAVDQYSTQLNSITSQYNSGQVKASWAGFGSVHGTGVAASAMKQMEKYTKDARNLYDKPMDFKINGKTFKDANLYDIYNNPSKYGLKPDAFVKEDEITGEKVKRDIKEVFVQGSQVPIMVSDRKEDWQYNDMLFEFEGDDLNIEGQTSFGNLGIDYTK